MHASECRRTGGCKSLSDWLDDIAANLRIDQILTK